MTAPRRPPTPHLRLERPGRRGERGRRRGGWQELRRTHPGILAAFGVAMLVLLGGDAWLLERRHAYRAESERLRASMTDVERERTDLVLASDERRLAVTLELLRRQAMADERLHVAVALDSGRLTLERDGIVLRAAAVRVGPERLVGTPPDTVRLSPPRGKRTVERVLGPDEPWEVPVWVYTERGLPAPADRLLPGALGEHAVILSGGAVLYALPDAGPLADSAYTLPGSLRLQRGDLRAMAPNLAPGTSVYIY
ncbi:MAG TPA: hypothetical protein VFS08_17520 [Gemmatimonadaceae bacterium]|nr:hypothetical protein [Gemmatimonadaceae bacterium]